MPEADSVHSTPPLNTSAETPLETAESPQESVYLPTDVSPEEAFQAIGRLRNEAEAEMTRARRAQLLTSAPALWAFVVFLPVFVAIVLSPVSG